MVSWSAPAPGKDRTFSVSRLNADGVAGADKRNTIISETVTVAIVAGVDLSPGSYTVPVVVRSGPLQTTATVQVMVSGKPTATSSTLYLPLIQR